MKFVLIDTNKGKIPSTITDAIKLSGYSRKDIEEYLEQNHGGAILVNTNGFNCKIVEKGWEHQYK